MSSSNSEYRNFNTNIAYNLSPRLYDTKDFNCKSSEPCIHQRQREYQWTHLLHTNESASLNFKDFTMIQKIRLFILIPSLPFFPNTFQSFTTLYCPAGDATVACFLGLLSGGDLYTSATEKILLFISFSMSLIDVFIKYGQKNMSFYSQFTTFERSYGQWELDYARACLAWKRSISMGIIP